VLVCVFLCVGVGVGMCLLVMVCLDCVYWCELVYVGLCYGVSF